jgi:hypothetical protein
MKGKPYETKNRFHNFIGKPFETIKLYYYIKGKSFKTKIRFHNFIGGIKTVYIGKRLRQTNGFSNIKENRLRQTKVLQFYRKTI